MRVRLLTPFVSALAGSVIVLVALVVWSSVRNESSTFALLDPSVAQAQTSTDGITVTFESDAPSLLGAETTFTATVELTAGLEYTMTWDLDGDGTADVTTGELDQSVVSGPFVYQGASEPGNPYQATAMVYVVGSDIVVSDTTLVEVMGPTIAIVAPPDPTAVDVGEWVTFTVTLSDLFDADASDPFDDVVAAISLDFGDGNAEELDISGSGVVTVTATHYYTSDGSFEVTATPLFGEYLDTGSRYEAPAEDTVTINVGQPRATLSITPPQPRLVGGSAMVVAEVTLENVAASAVEAIVFTFDDDDPITNTVVGGCLETPPATLPLSATKTYDEAGNYEVSALVILCANYNEQITAGPLNFRVDPESGVTVGSIELVVGTDELTAGNGPGTGETTVVTATVRDDNNQLLAGQQVSITLETALGATIGAGQTQITLGTNAEGQITTTLVAGSLAGQVTLVARTDNVSDTATVDVVLEDGVVQGIVTLGPTQTVTLEDGEGRTFTFNIPQQPGLAGAVVAIRIVPIPVGEGTGLISDSVGIYVVAFDVQVYAVNVPGVAAGTRLPNNLAGFNFTGFTAEFEYLPADLGTVTTRTLSLQREGPGVIESTLKLAEDDGEGGFRIIPGSTVNPTTNEVTSPIRQFGRHAIIGQDEVTIFLPFIGKTGAATATLTLR